MAVLAVQELVHNGAIEELTLEAAAASDTITNTEKEVLLMLSDNASQLTATITPGGTGIVPVGDSSVLTRTPATLTMGNDQPSLGAVGPLRVSEFGTAPVITPSATTSLSYALVRFP